MDVLERIERSTTAVEVTRILRDHILKGRYPPNSFIRQELIAQELGVSRIPVREALAQLEAEGLVIREKFRGALVPELSVTEIQEIYDLRLMIEPYLLREATTRMTPAHIAELREIVERSRRAEDVALWAGLNVDFHRTLYRFAERPLAMQVLENLLVRADRYLKMQRFLSAETQSESDAQHQRILEFVAASDTDAAAGALRDHIAWNAGDVLNTIGGLSDKR